MNFFTSHNIRRHHIQYIPFPQKDHVDPFRYYSKDDPRPVPHIIQRLRYKLFKEQYITLAEHFISDDDYKYINLDFP